MAPLALARGVNPYTYIPTNAKIYTPILDKQIKEYFPLFPIYYYFGGLIEQESCIVLTWHSCWNPKTQLRTSREQGAGLGQLTRAFYNNGKVRFDSLAALRREHMRELKNLSWSNIIQRPDLQMRGIILMSRDNYKRLWMIKNPLDRIAMSDSAYNAGLGRVYADRRLCNLEPHCNPNIWFGNVENAWTGARVPIYGNRTAHDINKTHVYNVLVIRMRKYKPYLPR